MAVPPFHRIYRQSLEQKRTGGDDPDNAAELVMFLCSKYAHNLTGKLISAVWDPWRRWGKKDIGRIQNSALYTLRRIDNKYYQQI